MNLAEAFASFPGRCPYPPAKHQVEGVSAIVHGEYLLLGDQMGCGKSKTSIDAAQVLFAAGLIDECVIVAPAAVRTDVWYDPEMGQLKRHLWPDTPSRILEYHARNRTWRHGKGEPYLTWTITNYEFINEPKRLAPLLASLKPRVMLVLDESSFVKSYASARTKACIQLRKAARNVVLLNGTPISHSPGDLYSQGLIMSPKILECKNWWHFRGRYAKLGGWQARQIVGWKNLEDMQRRFAPYVLRRLSKDVLDLPPALDPVSVSVPLSDASWRVYKDMREDLLSWLNEQTAAVSTHAGSKVMRLAQITSGFVGGVEEQTPCGCTPGGDCKVCGGSGIITEPRDPKSVGSEKLDFLRGWAEEARAGDSNLKLIVWCRFRYELERVAEVLSAAKLWGGQSRAERTQTLHLLNPRTAPEGPVTVVGIASTGALGLDLTASHTNVYLSNDTKLVVRLQSMARTNRPGQTCPVSYLDVLATGPAGQKTVDHAILKALREGEDVATWTCAAWTKALREE